MGIYDAAVTFFFDDGLLYGIKEIILGLTIDYYMNNHHCGWKKL